MATSRRGLVLLALLALCTPAPAAERPRNVILLIGDGMGFGQVNMARLADPGRRLRMDSMPVAGFLKVAPANGIVPDSAAAATAIATGFRTANGRISQLIDQTPVRTILEVAEAEGRSTGLVTNTTITHATTAAFAAHVKDRAMEWEIAAQMLDSGVDVMLGGGLAFFLPHSKRGSRRLDDRDLLQDARDDGFTVVRSRDDMLDAGGSRLLGLFQLRGMTTEPPEPSLTEMTMKAIELLSADEDGFLLVAEGGQIDWACHDNDAKGALKQMQDFDAMVGAVLSFTRSRGDTLVLVTADHETGGLVLQSRRGRGRWPFRVSWTTTGHTATDVPVLAEGPGAVLFTGVLESRDIARRLANLWELPGFEPAPAAAE